jgi:hypothetical protein
LSIFLSQGLSEMSQYNVRLGFRQDLRICIEFDDECQGCEESDLLIFVVHQTAGEPPSFGRSLQRLQGLLSLDNLFRPSRRVQLKYELSKVSKLPHG